MNVVFLTAVLLAAGPPFEVQTLDGQTLVGPLVELTADRLTLDMADGRASLETESVLSVSAKRQPTTARPAPGAVATLTDGSTVHVRQYAAQDGRARLTLSDGQTLEMPTSIVRSVRLQQQGGASAAEWDRLVNMTADADLLAVRKDETIDYHKGVVSDVTENAVRFELDGETLLVRRSKVYGFVYRRGPRLEESPTVCWIVDSAGSRWAANSLKLAEKLAWTTPAGLSVAQPVDAIVQIDFSGGKIAYLSDLKPEKVRWTPYFSVGKPLEAVEQFYSPRYDHDFEAKPLRLGGVEYQKGLALHARTEIVYRLSEPFRRFRAIAGIANAVHPGNGVRLTITGDGRELLDVRIAGDDAPHPVDLDLTGVRRLGIVVDFGDNPSTGDSLLLCNARLSK